MLGPDIERLIETMVWELKYADIVSMIPAAGCDHIEGYFTFILRIARIQGSYCVLCRELVLETCVMR